MGTRVHNAIPSEFRNGEKISLHEKVDIEPSRGVKDVEYEYHERPTLGRRIHNMIPAGVRRFAHPSQFMGSMSMGRSSSSGSSFGGGFGGLSKLFSHQNHGRTMLYRHSGLHSFLFNFFGAMWIVIGVLCFFLPEFAWSLFCDIPPLFRLEDRVVMKIIGAMAFAKAAGTYAKMHAGHKTISTIFIGCVAETILVTLACISYSSILSWTAMLLPLVLIAETVQLGLANFNVVPIHMPVSAGMGSRSDIYSGRTRAPLYHSTDADFAPIKTKKTSSFSSYDSDDHLSSSSSYDHDLNNNGIDDSLEYNNDYNDYYVNDTVNNRGHNLGGSHKQRLNRNYYYVNDVDDQLPMYPVDPNLPFQGPGYFADRPAVGLDTAAYPTQYRSQEYRGAGTSQYMGHDSSRKGGLFGLGKKHHDTDYDRDYDHSSSNKSSWFGSKKHHDTDYDYDNSTNKSSWFGSSRKDRDIDTSSSRRDSSVERDIIDDAKVTRTKSKDRTSSKISSKDASLIKKDVPSSSVKVEKDVSIVTTD